MRCFQFQGCTCEPQRRSISRVVKLAMYPSVLKILHRYTRLERAWTRFPSLSDRRTCRVTYIAVSNVPTVSFERELFRVEVFWYTLRVEASFSKRGFEVLEDGRRNFGRIDEISLLIFFLSVALFVFFGHSVRLEGRRIGNQTRG